MTILKEINDLHLSLKSLLVSLLAIMPFWYLAIFLFHRDFFISAPFYISIVVSYCLTVVHFAISYIINDKIKKKDEVDPEIEEDFQSRVVTQFFIATFLSLVAIVAAICFGFIFNWNFYLFLRWLFIPLVGFYVLILIDKKINLKKLPGKTD